MRIEPLSDVLGASVEGVDFADAVDVDRLKQALADTGSAVNLLAWDKLKQLERSGGTPGQCKIRPSHVTVKAAKAGDIRFKVTMISDELTRPVEETEATNQYE